MIMKSYSTFSKLQGWSLSIRHSLISWRINLVTWTQKKTLLFNLTNYLAVDIESYLWHHKIYCFHLSGYFTNLQDQFGITDLKSNIFVHLLLFLEWVNWELLAFIQVREKPFCTVKLKIFFDDLSPTHHSFENFGKYFCRICLLILHLNRRVF